MYLNMIMLTGFVIRGVFITQGSWFYVYLMTFSYRNDFLRYGYAEEVGLWF